MSKRDVYIEKMKHQLDELNVRLNEMDVKVSEAQDDVRDRYKKEMDKLHSQYKVATTKLDELTTAGEDSWAKLAAETEKVRDAIVHSFRYFKSQL